MRASLLLALAVPLLAETPTADELAKWREAYTYIPAPFEATETVVEADEKVQQIKVTFPSPRPSGDPRNDLVEGWLFEPRKKETDRGIILCPIWKEKKLSAETPTARILAKKGYKVLVLAMAYQYDRGPEEHHPGQWTMSSDLDRTERVFYQSVQDISRAGEWLRTKKGVAEGKLGIAGLSLGGAFASIAYCLDPQFKCAVLMLTGGDVATMMLSENEDLEYVRRELTQYQGYTLETLRTRVRMFDPATWATPERGKAVFMLNADQDDIVTPAASDVLWKAYGEPKRNQITGTHRTAGATISFLLDDVVRHLDTHLK